jgi:hypothetical protein
MIANKWTLMVGPDLLASHIGMTAKTVLDAAKAAATYANHGEVVTVCADHLRRPRKFLVTRLGVSEIKEAA